MDNVTVMCACGRPMRPAGGARRGTFACGCGSRVTVTVTEAPLCAFLGDDGSRCRTRPGPEGAKIGLIACPEHFMRLTAVFESLHDPVSERQAALQLMMEATGTGEGGEETAEAAEFRAAAHDRHHDPAYYVYYVQIGDRVKIGVTGNLKLRMGGLMPDEVLAVEPGDQKLETMRHRQFAHLRIRGERFRPGDDLMSHIEMLRKHYPDLVMTLLPTYAAPPR